jgi:hypothetical protein
MIIAKLFLISARKGALTTSELRIEVQCAAMLLGEDLGQRHQEQEADNGDGEGVRARGSTAGRPAGAAPLLPCVRPCEKDKNGKKSIAKLLWCGVNCKLETTTNFFNARPPMQFSLSFTPFSHLSRPG